MNNTTPEADALISVDEFDRRFDDGEDITMHLDVENARYYPAEKCTVAVDLPPQVLAALELEAARAGARVADLIESWVEDRLGLPSAV
jgi:hypothetical protein